MPAAWFNRVTLLIAALVASTGGVGASITNCPAFDYEQGEESQFPGMGWVTTAQPEEYVRSSASVDVEQVDAIAFGSCVVPTHKLAFAVGCLSEAQMARQHSLVAPRLLCDQARHERSGVSLC